MKKKVYKYVIELIVLSVLTLYLFMNIISVTQVVGNSMYPTMHDNDLLIMNKTNIDRKI